LTGSAKHIGRSLVWSLLLTASLTALNLQAAAPADLSGLAREWVSSGSPADRAALADYADRNSGRLAAYARLALGYKDYLAGEYQSAAKELALVGDEPQLAPYAVYYRGKSLALAEQHQDAASTLQGYSQRFPYSRLAAAADRIRAESLIRAQQFQEAETLLQPKASSVQEAARFYLLGRVLELTGRRMEAIPVYRQAYYFYPTSAEADLAEKQLDAIRLSIGNAYPAAPRAWRFERGRRLYSARKYADAIDQFRWAQDGLTGADLEEANLRYGVANYLALRTTAAYEWLSKTSFSNADREAERLYYLGECERRQGAIDKFRSRADELKQRFPQSKWYEESLLSLGNFYLLRNDGAESGRFYARLAADVPKGEHADLAHWKVCWRAYLDRDPQVRKLFEEHVRRYPSSGQISAALYWIGRIDEKSNSLDSARALYTEIDSRYPNHYYADLARRRLDEIGKGAPVASVTALTQHLPMPRKLAPQVGPEMSAVLDRGRLLFDLGLDEDAEGELIRADYRKADSLWVGLELFRIKSDRLEHGRGLRYMKRYGFGYLNIPVYAAPRAFWEGLYPMPWEADLRKRAEPHGLDPYLVAGLIRQESEYDHAAVSRAGAIGLMQVMPSTGSAIFQKLGIPGFSPAKLRDPDVSLRLGTYHLKEVVDRFNGSLELALAAYNAGAKRADEWITWGNFEEPAEFVETIPFTETRGYVQSVLRNRDMYRRLYGPQGGADAALAARE
jgi:soluble lytic murein transglycosylase